MMRRIFVFLVLTVFVCMSTGSFAYAGEKAGEKAFPVVTGENWMNATHEERLSFVMGLTTMIELEKEVQGQAPPADQRSLIPRWVQGLERFTLEEIVAALDDAYRKHPDFKSRPVVDVLWREVAFPVSGN